MHYDRPVRALLADCVRELEAPFDRQDVLRWFERNYPLVKATTVSTHLAGLTQGAHSNSQFRGRPPLVRRVRHGLYEPVGQPSGQEVVPPAHPGAGPRAHGEPPSAAGLLLLGCVKSKLAQPAPAQDLYTSPLFQRRRRYAETAGLPWFVLSARYGLVRPDEVIAPYDVHLAAQPASYRAAWGVFVVEQLRRERSDLSGLVVEVHAGDAYLSAIRDPLQKAGAVVLDPVDAGSMGETLAWYDRNPTAAAPGVTPPRAAAQVQDSDRLAESVHHLDDPGRAVPVPELLRLNRTALERPGLYSWWVDELGARELSAGLGLPVGAGLVYAGQAGATRWPSGRRSSNTLWSRLTRMHARGRADFSTFRRTLAAVLREPLALTHEDDPRLDDWIDGHLSVVALPVDDPDALAALEDDVLEELDPPLNLKGMAPSAVRGRLSQLRRERT